MTDQELLTQLSADPPGAMRILLERYGPAVRGVVFHILGPARQEDAEECVADVFIRLWERQVQREAIHVESLRAYLMRMAQNTAIDRLRKLAREQAAEFPEQAPAPDNVEQAVIKQEQQDDLHAQLAALPEPERTIFTERYLNDRPVQEIAASLHLSRKQVYNRLARGKSRLRRLCEERGLLP